MNVDDILYSPIMNWRQRCADITVFIEQNRDCSRLLYDTNRPRPFGALLLFDFVTAFHSYGQRYFWRLRYPDIQQFEFDGVIKMVGPEFYSGYSEVGVDHLRSIEDDNLVPNTYTNFYIFCTEQQAQQALNFVAPK